MRVEEVEHFLFASLSFVNSVFLARRPLPTVINFPCCSTVIDLNARAQTASNRRLLNKLKRSPLGKAVTASGALPVLGLHHTGQPSSLDRLGGLFGLANYKKSDDSGRS